MAKRFSEKQRAALLARFERWEGSAAAFCRKHGLSYQTLRGWRRSASANSPPVEAPRFVEIELRPEITAPSELRRQPVAELDLGAGVVLRVYPIQEDRS
jgi:transposase-like protein